MPWKTRSPTQDFALFLVAGTPIIALFFVILRYLAKYRSTGITADDHILAVASLFSIIIIYPSWRWIRMWCFGIHVWECRIGDVDMHEYYQIQMVFNMFSNPILPLVKASILWLLHRVGGFLPSVHRAVKILFIFNALVCIIPEFFLLFQCPPLKGEKWADRTFGGAHCLGRRALGRLNIFQVSVSIFTDLLVFPIPIYLVYKLEKLDMKNKFLIVLMFSMSLLVTGLGGLRIFFTYEERLFSKIHKDWTYWNIRFVVQHAENSSAIIFASIPSLRALVSTCFGRRESIRSGATRGARTSISVGGPREMTSNNSSDSGKLARLSRAFKFNSTIYIEEIVKGTEKSSQGEEERQFYQETGSRSGSSSHTHIRNDIAV